MSSYKQIQRPLKGRFTQVVNTLSTSDGGPARNSFELNLALNAANSETNLFWFRGDVANGVVFQDSAATGKLPTPGPRRVGVLSNDSKRVASVWDFLHSILNSDAVIIHGYYLPWVPIVAVVCKLTRTPFVITPHGALTSHQQKFSQRKKRIFERLVGKRTRKWMAGFVTGSAIEAADLKSQFPGVNAEFGGVGTVLPNSLHPTISQDHLQLVSMSRIAPKKRIDLMIGAVAELKLRGVTARLRIGGTGDPFLEKALREQCSRLGVVEEVTFEGHIDGAKKESLYASAAIFLLPSDDENFGIGLAEALARGIPCIASANVAAAAYMNGAGGIVLDSPTEKSIADAITELRSSKDWEALRRSARRVAEDNFSWDATALRWQLVLASHVIGIR